MARLQNIGTSEDWFCGEDKTLEFEIFSSDEVTMENMTGKAMQWVMRRGLEGDPIVVNKTTAGGTITINGVYNSDMDINQQRVRVAVARTDTYRLQPGRYDHTLKVVDPGNATVCSYGTVELKKAAI